MQTPYDFLTMAIFAGLIVIFLQRSMAEHRDDDPMWRYLLAAGGCAVGNYLGNAAYHLPALIVIVGTLAFIVHAIRPFSQFRRP